ncbi:MAG: phosphate/phosphite/phosphonate ABC transporter substrate-binding protein [Planktomarina sp.]
MIAHLPMYDRPANRAAYGRLWHRLQQHLPSAPPLTPCNDLWAGWADPDLFISQTCGLPYRAKLHGKVQIIGTADHRLDGCAPGQYRSAIITRAPVDMDAGHYTLAVNDPLSQSGWAAIHTRPGQTQIITGSHANSAKAVLEGRADAAAIDALTWRFLQRDWDGAADLTVQGWTPPTPALPFITSLNNDPNVLFKALRAAIRDLSAQDQDQLGLYDLIKVPSSDYLALPIPPAPKGAL